MNCGATLQSVEAGAVWDEEDVLHQFAYMGYTISHGGRHNVPVDAVRLTQVAVYEVKTVTGLHGVFNICDKPRQVV